MAVNSCVACGQEIPEGDMLCLSCKWLVKQKETEDKFLERLSKEIRTKKEPLGNIKTTSNNLIKGFLSFITKKNKEVHEPSKEGKVYNLTLKDKRNFVLKKFDGTSWIAPQPGDTIFLFGKEYIIVSNISGRVKVKEKIA